MPPTASSREIIKGGKKTIVRSAVDISATLARAVNSGKPRSDARRWETSFPLNLDVLL
jgi:hypothetical protein